MSTQIAGLEEQCYSLEQGKRNATANLAGMQTKLAAANAARESAEAHERIATVRCQELNAENAKLREERETILQQRDASVDSHKRTLAINEMHRVEKERLALLLEEVRADEKALRAEITRLSGTTRSCFTCRWCAEDNCTNSATEEIACGEPDYALWEDRGRCAGCEGKAREIERLKEDHGRACESIAKMHGAFFGFGNGPKRGVIEDMEDKAAEIERLSALYANVAGSYGVLSTKCSAQDDEIARLQAKIAAGCGCCHVDEANAADERYRERLDAMVAQASLWPVEESLPWCDTIIGRATQLLAAIDAHMAARAAKREEG
ncbi:MAG: hypothetical protein WC829_02695 [Hyphomicrobium sp.]